MALLPKVKLKTVVSFPAAVHGGVGVNVDQTNGIYTLSLNYGNVALANSIPDPLEPTEYLVTWQQSTNFYSRISITDFKADFNFQPADPTLAALAALDATPGVLVETAADTFAKRTLQQPAAGLTIANPQGIAGNPTFALANDLAALEGLATTGLARRTAVDTWSAGTAVVNAELATMNAFTFKGNNTSGAAVPTDVDIAGLTTKAPAASDFILVSDQAAAGAWKKATVSSVGSVGSVSSIAGNTGAFTLSNGITNLVNDIRLNAGHLPGEPSTGAAAAGEVGELITSTATTGTLASGANTNITSITLSAGEWDIMAGYSASGGSSPSVTDIFVSINTVTGVNVNTAGQAFRFRGTTLADPVTSGTLGPLRVKLSASTTYYLNTFCTYSTGTFAVTGILSARRVR